MRYDPQRRYWLGIDPGLDGALALYDPIGRELIALRMPTVTVRHRLHGATAAKQTKRVIDGVEIAAWFEVYAPFIRTAIIEQVGARPDQGVVSMFSFGLSTGTLHGILYANQIEFEQVAPATWKSTMRVLAPGEKKSTKKKTSITMATKLFPKYADLVKHDGVAEAALIAVYASAVRAAENYKARLREKEPTP